MTPEVTVIINNYNYDRYLQHAIDSALQQTYPHTQVIVVDDCSTDRSREIIAEYGDRILPVLHETNGKQGAAFNSGFAISKGDIIIFLDSDDCLYPDAVEQIVAVWQPETAKVHYRLSVVDQSGKPRGFSYPQGDSQLARGEVWREVVTAGSYAGVPTSGNALSRSVLQQIFPIPGEFSMTADDYLSVSVPLYGEVIAIEKPLGAYRIHTNNQWALTTISSERFHRFIRHDLQKCELIRSRGRALGYDVPDDLETRSFGRMWSRLSSLRFDPATHPVTGDRPFYLAILGIRALWLYSSQSWKKQVFYTLWFIWVGLAPRRLALPAIVWLFSPQARPTLGLQMLRHLPELFKNGSLNVFKSNNPSLK